MVSPKRVVRRYRRASLPAPELFWLSWNNVNDRSLQKVIEFLQKINSFASDSNLKKDLAQLRAVQSRLDSIKPLESVFREFRGKRTWDDVLEATARKLAQDKKLRLALTSKIPNFVDETCLDAVADALDKSVDQRSFKSLEPAVYTLYDYAEDKTGRSQADKAVATLEAADFRRPVSILRQLAQISPDVEELLHGQRSYEGFSQWVQKLKSSLDNKVYLETILESWEDELPSSDPGTNATELLDTTVLNDKDYHSPLHGLVRDLQDLHSLFKPYRKSHA